MGREIHILWKFKFVTGYIENPVELVQNCYIEMILFPLQFMAHHNIYIFLFLLVVNFREKQ